MKLHNARTFVLAAATTALVLGVASHAAAQSRLKDGEPPHQVVWMDKPQEIAKIRKLLQRNKTDKAVEMAEGLLRLDMPARYRYDALNALCVARTQQGSMEAAMQACSTAIAMMPSRWEALNSRGTVYLLSGNIDDAIADYQRALKAAPGSAVVEHNLDLAEQRLMRSHSAPMATT